MLPPQIRIIGVPGIPEVLPGDSPGDLIAAAARRGSVSVCAGDVFVVAQKIVSKAEGQIVDLNTVTPSALAGEWGRRHGKDPRVVETVLGEARRVVRMDRGRLIVETHSGFICANAGVDNSNTAPDKVTTLPRDCDASACRIRRRLEEEFGVGLAVIVSDTFGRPWRNGLTNVALGVSGLKPLLDLAGVADAAGRPLRATVLAVADDLASAAGLMMGKTRRLPVVLIRGAGFESSDSASGRDLLRPAEEDLFR